MGLFPGHAPIGFALAVLPGDAVVFQDVAGVVEAGVAGEVVAFLEVGLGFFQRGLRVTLGDADLFVCVVAVGVAEMVGAHFLEHFVPAGEHLVPGLARSRRRCR